jgi:hypothetical protein
MAIGRRRNIRFFFHNPIGIVGAPGILSPSLSIYTDLYSPLSVCVCVCAIISVWKILVLKRMSSWQLLSCSVYINRERARKYTYKKREYKVHYRWEGIYRPVCVCGGLHIISKVTSVYQGLLGSDKSQQARERKCLSTAAACSLLFLQD